MNAVSLAPQIENFTVLHRGGLVLWSKSFSQSVMSKGKPVNALVSEVLLEVRAAADFLLP